MMEIWEEEGERDSERRDGPGDEIGSDSVIERIRNIPMYSPSRSLTDWPADQVQPPPLDLFGIQLGYEASLPPATTTVCNIEASLGYEASLFGLQFEYEAYLPSATTTMCHFEASPFGLLKLESLIITHCSQLESIITDCSQLGSLIITDCSQLSLKITGCSQLESLIITRCSQLSLIITDCPKLGSLIITNCSQLSLKITGCSQLESLIITLCPQLSLKITGCSKLESLKITRCSQLSLKITGCSKLGSLKIKGCSQLSLKITGSSQLSLILIIIHCSQLSLIITHCSQLESLIITHCSQLSLIITDCSQLESLIITDFSQLESLIITHCSQLELIITDYSQLEWGSKKRRKVESAEKNCIAISHSKKKITIETPKRKYRTKRLITYDDLQQLFGRKRVDAAKTLGVSVPTFKRHCRQNGITWWNGDGCSLVEPMLVNNSVQQNSSGPKPPEVQGEKELSALSGARQDAQTFELRPGVEIIQLDSFEERIFGELGAKNIGQKAESAEKSCIAISHSKKKNTIASPKREYRTKRLITYDDLQQLFGQKRVDAAKTLGVSVPTFKRYCRQNGITWWNGDGCSLVEPKLLNNSVHQNSSGSKPPEVQGEKEISALLGTRQDAVTIKAKSEGGILKLQLSSESGFAELQEAVAKRLKSQAFIVEYEDEDQELIVIACDEDWQACVKFFGNQVIRLAIR